MFVSVESAEALVRLDGRFDASQARSLEQMFSIFRPVRSVVIDFANVREADAAAVASLARTLCAARESRVTLRGLSGHLRRVLRYVGIEAVGLSDPEQPAGTLAG
jgi:anti-anti-sigma regulatory factor